MTDIIKALPQNVSLYPKHLRLIERIARREGLDEKARHLSPTVQHIIEHYARLTNLDTDETPAPTQEAA